MRGLLERIRWRQSALVGVFLLVSLWNPLTAAIGRTDRGWLPKEEVPLSAEITASEELEDSSLEADDAAEDWAIAIQGSITAALAIKALLSHCNCYHPFLNYSSQSARAPPDTRGRF